MRRLAGVIAIACGCLAAACLYSSPEVKPAPKQEDAPRRPDATIGAYLSMTGPQASFGIATLNGIALAVEEQNRAGGVRGGRIRLRTIDTAGKAAEAATAVGRLISDEGAIAILGEVASGLTLAGAPIAQHARVPMISPAATHPDVTAAGDMIWRACALDAEQAAAMAAFARHRLRLARVAVLYDAGQPYSSGLASLFEQAFARLGGTIATTQAFSGMDADLQMQLAAIRDAKVDAVFVPVFYSVVGPIASGLRALGVTAPLLGADGWDSPELAGSAGAAIDGSYYTGVFAADDPRPIVRAFVTRYRAKHGADPDGLAALGYDAARLLFDAMSRARSRSGEDLAAAIGATRGLPGVTGPITMGPDREPKKPIPVLQLRAGKPVLAATMPPR